MVGKPKTCINRYLGGLGRLVRRLLLVLVQVFGCDPECL
jgi:hypothetical protein